MYSNCELTRTEPGGQLARKKDCHPGTLSRLAMSSKPDPDLEQVKRASNLRRSPREEFTVTSHSVLDCLFIYSAETGGGRRNTTQPKEPSTAASRQMERRPGGNSVGGVEFFDRQIPENALQ
jgi:hypothetical protein